MTGSQFASKINQVLNREPLHIAPDNAEKMIETVGWCTGGGQDFIELAVQHGLDAFISGEISERTTYTAREMDIHYLLRVTMQQSVMASKHLVSG